MKVKHMIRELQKCDPEAPVFIYKDYIGDMVPSYRIYPDKDSYYDKTNQIWFAGGVVFITNRSASLYINDEDTPEPL